MCDRVHESMELMFSASARDEESHSERKMTEKCVDAQGIKDANKVKPSPVGGQLHNRRRPTKRPRNDSMDASDAKVGGAFVKTMLQRFVLWSAKKTLNLSLIASVAQIICLANLIILNIKCDEDVRQTHQPEVYNQQNSQASHQVKLNDLIKQQRDPRGILNLDELLSTQDSTSSLSYNLINPASEMPDEQQQQPGDNQLASDGSIEANTQQQQQQVMQEPRDNDQAESDQLETAQTKAQGSTTAKTSESNEKATPDSPNGSVTSSPAPPASSSATSSASSSLSEHLSAVNNLLHQAGQIGLSAAQQNVALSEAIINSVTNSLVGNNRKQNGQVQAGAQTQQAQQSSRPLVGQSIDGNIEYNPNSNTIDGFINFPTNFSGVKPSLSGAMKPLLLAAIKTVPVKFGSVGWKLLKLLAWKKIYKAHHPKSSEIVIEQEMKQGGHGGGGGFELDKGGKLGSKISDHFESKLKTSKMGQSYSGGGSDDWTSMMRSPGMGPDMFSSSWPHGDSHAASASMIYQRHLLPPGAANQQQAAAAAAAAAATAAAIQSHWQQQQQQQMMADETSESQLARANQTSSANQSANGQGALRRKKATFGGSNWFAANPAHTYAAAAAAANAAAAMASQHQQQQQQRLAGIMRAYELGGQHSDHMSSSSSSGGMHHALATGLMYQSLFDNAAAMAVQNTVRLPGLDHQGSHQNPLANAEFLDQSDTLSGSSFDSFSSSGAESGHDSSPLTLMQRNDLEGNFGGSNVNQGGGHKFGMDGMMNEHSYGILPTLMGPRRSGSLLDGMPEFDDNPRGKLAGTFNETYKYAPRRSAHNPPENIRWK